MGWKSLKSLNLKQREELLAAICMTFQETVGGNSNRSTVDFVDWGRQWGTDEMDAQVLLMNQWDNILHRLMGITAVMEVWPPQTPGSSPSLDGEENHSMAEEPIVASCFEGEEAPHEEMNATEEHLQVGNTGGIEAHHNQKREQEE